MGKGLWNQKRLCVNWEKKLNSVPETESRVFLYSTISFLFSLFPISLSCHCRLLLLCHFPTLSCLSGLGTPGTPRRTQKHSLAQVGAGSYGTDNRPLGGKENQVLTLLQDDLSLKYSSNFDWALSLYQAMTRKWRWIRCDPRHKTLYYCWKEEYKNNS